ncbi:hypothetical protein E2C01_048893 [Portunus trituberculatus]|uniref:Wolframin n=1 Tax=Portunus trituberculatus TaxID=210409 RepID=A0A5B7G7R4_PORTR|nr:hypothetical protein [Portunus trituberculatus]
MELQEKLARRAGRLLFASISDGNEVVSSSSLARRIQEVVAGDVAAPCTDPKAQDSQPDPTAPAAPTASKSPNTASLEELYGGERYTEDHIISAAILHHHGCIPPLHHLLALPLTPTHHRSPSALHSLTHKPLKLLRDVYDAFLQFFAVSLVCFVRRYGVFVSAFCIVVLSVVLYVFGLRLSVFSGVLPVVVFCLGFVVMVAASSAILLNGKRLSCHQMWSKVFVYFCGELDVSVSERRGDAEVSLHADNTFANFMLGLKGGEVVEFTGTMVDGVGTHHLSLSLSAIKCVSCKLKECPEKMTFNSVSKSELSDLFFQAVRGVFNFIFSPTLTL